jgi:hypothetical protein
VGSTVGRFFVDVSALSGCRDGCRYEQRSVCSRSECVYSVQYRLQRFFLTAVRVPVALSGSSRHLTKNAHRLLCSTMASYRVLLIVTTVHWPGIRLPECLHLKCLHPKCLHPKCLHPKWFPPRWFRSVPLPTLLVINKAHKVTLQYCNTT